MQVYVLSAGRCGEKTLASACSYMSNYTLRGDERATSRIVIDKQLLHRVDSLDDGALFVHLRGDPEHTASIYQRFGFDAETVSHWSSRLNEPINTAAGASSLDACREYVDRTNAAIEAALAVKPDRLDMNANAMAEDFRTLWERIDAEGDLEAALKLFEIHDRINDLVPLYPPIDVETEEQEV